MAKRNMAIEKQLDFLVEKFGTFETKLNALDTKVDTVDKKVDGVDAKVDALGVRVGALETGLAAVETGLNSVKAHVGTLDSNVSSLGSAVGKLDARMGTVEKKVDRLMVTGERTQDLVELSLEGLAGLRETTAAGFKTMAEEHAEQIGLHKTTLLHLRKRVERVERRKPRSR